MIFGVLLILLAALAGALLFRSSNSRSQALVLRNDLATGQELQTTDLVVVEIDAVPNLKWVPANSQDEIVGLSARGPLSGGQLVSASMFTERAATIGSETVIIAAAVRPGAIPPTSQVGDTVSIQVTNADESANLDGLGESTPVGEAVIWSIAGTASTSGEVVVELAVPSGDERRVSQAASSGRMKLNLTGDE